MVNLHHGCDLSDIQTWARASHEAVSTLLQTNRDRTLRREGTQSSVGAVFVAWYPEIGTPSV